MSKSFRMYPSLTLEEATGKLEVLYDQVGKGPSSKEAYVKGLGYKGISGASNRMFAALVHYGLIEKAGPEYKVSELGLHIVLPDDERESTKQNYLRQAALRPSLFRDIYEKYLGEKLPVLLHNTLVHDFRVYDKSGKEAADTFRQTLDFAGLLNDGVVGAETGDQALQNSGTDNSSHTITNTHKTRKGVPTRPDSTSGEAMNRMELVLREGVVAVIDVPANLSDIEKVKLKAIIDLL